MANNRMFLKCTLCDGTFSLAKYYPITGWYTNQIFEQNALLDNVPNDDEHYAEVIIEWYESLQEFLFNHSPCPKKNTCGEYDPEARRTLHGNPTGNQLSDGEVFTVEYE